MGKSLKDNLRMAILARANDDQAVKARMDSMDSAVEPINAPPQPTIPADHSNRQTQQTDPADKSSRQAPLRSSTEESHRRVRQLNPTLQQTNSADNINRPTQQTIPADKFNNQFDQTSSADKSNRPIQQTNTADQYSRASAEPLPIRLGPRPGVVTPAQKTILEYFRQIGSHVSTYRVIAKETSVPHGTVRCVIDKLVNLGMLRREPWGRGSYRALQFIVCDSEQVCPTNKPSRPIQQTNPTNKSSTQIQQRNSSEELHRGIQQVSKIDREDLSISSEDLRLHWPNLARVGFGLDQLKQIEASLAKIGLPLDRVYQGLAHAEWEIEHGQMLDKGGQPVADPCSWVFTALARTGYYRRPKGYVSPEEQAAKDAEAEAKAVVAARQAAEQAQFEAWRDGLSPDEMTEALRGHPGGPKDAWLKKVWRDRRN